MDHAHPEEHFTSTEIIRDIIIGMSDGLTVPFALSAGLTGAIESNSLIIAAGMAEIAAGSIAMGLGGYLAAKNDMEHYISEEKREFREIEKIPEMEKKEIIDIFNHYGISVEECKPVVEALSKNKNQWVNFMMRFELGLEKPNPKRAITSGGTIAGSYIVGGIIPLVSYFMFENINTSLMWSAVITSVALLLFGYFKGKIVSANPIKSAVRTFLIGGLAATVAYLLAKLFA